MRGPPLSPEQLSVPSSPWAQICDLWMSIWVRGPSWPWPPAWPYWSVHFWPSTILRKVYWSSEDDLDLSVLPHPATVSSRSEVIWRSWYTQMGRIMSVKLTGLTSLIMAISFTATGFSLNWGCRTTLGIRRVKGNVSTSLSQKHVLEGNWRTDLIEIAREFKRNSSSFDP